MSTVVDKKNTHGVSPDAFSVPFKVRAFDLLAAGNRKEAEELASLGRKEIQLAEDEMPGLMALRARPNRSVTRPDRRPHPRPPRPPRRSRRGRRGR